MIAGKPAFLSAPTGIKIEIQNTTDFKIRQNQQNTAKRIIGARSRIRVASIGLSFSRCAALATRHHELFQLRRARPRIVEA
jgi:hypothetical protein